MGSTSICWFCGPTMSPGDLQDELLGWDLGEAAANAARLTAIRTEIRGRLLTGPIHRNSTRAAEREAETYAGSGMLDGRKGIGARK